MFWVDRNPIRVLPGLRLDSGMIGLKKVFKRLMNYPRSRVGGLSQNWLIPILSKRATANLIIQISYCSSGDSSSPCNQRNLWIKGQLFSRSEVLESQLRHNIAFALQ